MEWYVESCPHFRRPMSGKPPSKRARRPSLSPDEDDYDTLSRDQYQENWDELKNLRELAESNRQRINEMEDLVHSFAAYKMYDEPAPTSYYERYEVENSYFNQFEIPRQSYEIPRQPYEIPRQSYDMPASSSYEMGRSSCVVRPTYTQDFGTSGYVPNMPSHSAFDNRGQFRNRGSSSNDFLEDTISEQNMRQPCGGPIIEEHFDAPSSESDAPMEDTHEPHVPAPRPGFIERWTSKKIFTPPWGNKRSGKKK